MRGMVLFEVEIGAAQSITEGVSSHFLLEHQLKLGGSLDRMYSTDLLRLFSISSVD